MNKFPYNEEMATRSALNRLIALADVNFDTIDSALKDAAPPEDTKAKAAYYESALKVALVMAETAKETIAEYRKDIAAIASSEKKGG